MGSRDGTEECQKEEKEKIKKVALYATFCLSVMYDNRIADFKNLVKFAGF